MKAAVLASGSWGTALAVHLSKKYINDNIYLWSRNKEKSERLAIERENREFLPGIRLAGNIICTNDLRECLDGAEIIITAPPSSAARQTAQKMSGYVKKGSIVVNVSKGLEGGTLARLSEVYRAELPQAEIAVMSGPSHAEEVSRGVPTTNVAVSENAAAAKYIQDIFMTDNFRVYTSSDMIGVEMGGALKNIIALCAGISDGLGFGDNTKAALMTRGLAEITRLGASMGAKTETFSGLSGLGDLIVTCTSMHSRNRRAGILLGKGKTLSETLSEIHMVVEGVNAARSALELSQKYGVQMPITAEANKILFEGKNPLNAVTDLMTRDKTHEIY